MSKRKDFDQKLKMRECVAFEHMILEAEMVYGTPLAVVLIRSVKGFPTVDPVDYVCLICGKWMSDIVG